MLRMLRTTLAAMAIAILAAPSLGDMAVKRLGTPPSGNGKSAGKAARGGRPTAYVLEAKAPALDGKLDDECWSKARAIQLARTLDGGGNASQPTEVKLCHDGKNLYVAVKAIEPLLNKLQAAARGHDGPVWGDDSVEMFIGTGAAYYHIGVNAAGSVYDGKAKDGSWNSSTKAAVGKEASAWTLEVAIPLADLGGDAKSEWIFNITRNRQTTGSTQESAWSPTGSGDSHIPERFGKLVFGEPEEKPALEASKKDVLEVMPAKNGLGVLRFDLSGLPKGAKVVRADLLLFRTANIDGTFDEVLTDIEVFGLARKFDPDGEAKPEGKPLAIRGPWFDRLDATEVVAQWMAGKENGGFFVQACPMLAADASTLDIYYEGKVESPPPQVAEVKAVHRAGQTFITFKEIEELVPRDEMAWGEFKTVLDEMDRMRQVCYAVYRHDKPITPATLASAELLAQVRPLSGWNINGRSIEGGIDHVIETQYALIHGHWNPFCEATQDGKYGRECPMVRLAVEDGQVLPRHMGLYVHTAAAKGKAYYAVVASIDGVQNTAELGKNVVGPIDEAVAAPEPVLQREFPKLPYFNYREKRLHYVTFVGPPYANVPCQYYNWSVGVPEGSTGVPPVSAAGETPATQIPLELNLPTDARSCQRTPYRIEPDSLAVVPHDFPVDTWWYGYHESLGTLKSFKQGVIQPYTERRILRFLEWAAAKWPVNKGQVLVTSFARSAGGPGPSSWGGSTSGAVHLAFRHPEVFCAVYPGGGARADYASQSAPSMFAIWGKIDWALKTDTGKSVWDEHNIVKLVEAAPASTDLPLLTMTGRNAPKPVLDLAGAMLEKGWFFAANYNEWSGPKLIPYSSNGSWPGAMIPCVVRKDRPLPCFGKEKAAGIRGAAKGFMLPNLGYRWADAADSAQKVEITLWREGREDAATDLTLRRVTKFKVEKGKSYAWALTGADGKEIASGQAAGEDAGVLSLPAFKVPDKPSKLTVK